MEGNEESTLGLTEGDSGDKIYLVNIDIGQHAVGFAVGNKPPYVCRDLADKLKIQTRATELDNF
jgi:hypothetical protein